MKVFLKMEIQRGFMKAVLPLYKEEGAAKNVCITRK